MYNDEILAAIAAAIAAAKKAGSFKLRLVFTPLSEISRIRSFVTMLKGRGIAVDDETMMKLRLVALSRRWQEDTDRVVVMDICDDFDENEFVARFAIAIESIEAVPRDIATGEQKILEGSMDPQKAIRHAKNGGPREIKIVIPKAKRGDVAFVWSMFKHKQISFVNADEQKVFEAAFQNPEWSLGGKLTATIRLEEELHEHMASGILRGAHVRVKTIAIMR